MFDPGDIDYDISIALGAPSALAISRPIYQRSTSSETIRPRRGHTRPVPPSPPRLTYPVPTTDIERPTPQPSAYLFKSSQYIHDGDQHLNFSYDYKFISLEDLIGHTIFRSIQLELYTSARLMSRADLALGHRETSRGNDNAKLRLLPRHVNSLPHLSNVNIYGNLRESYVALLAMIALKAGIKIVSVDRLRELPGQTEMYQQVAGELEEEMSAAYEESRRIRCCT
ncbi:hypothetical protein C0991_000673 [Blastosporella zonata]|nr:hypothetical protein C0991_000673 [Blastosporella zonata]